MHMCASFIFINILLLYANMNLCTRTRNPSLSCLLYILLDNFFSLLLNVVLSLSLSSSTFLCLSRYVYNILYEYYSSYFMWTNGPYFTRREANICISYRHIYENIVWRIPVSAFRHWGRKQNNQINAWQNMWTISSRHIDIYTHMQKERERESA